MRRAFGWFRRRLNSWDEICVDERARFRTDVILCTLLVCFICLFMLVVNLLRGTWAMALFLLLLLLLYGCMFGLQLMLPRYQSWIAWIFGLTAIAMGVILLFTDTSAGLSFLWIYIIPHVAVMVVPLVDSLVYNGMLLGVLLAVLHTPLRQFLPDAYHGTFGILFPISLFFIMCCVYLAELVRARTQNRLRATSRQLQALAYIDQLTGAGNRHSMVPDYGDIEKADSAGMAFLMMDLDYFKRVNDAHGHFVGDALLQHLVQLVLTRLPEGAKLYRWGGEEFLLVAHVDSQTQALQLAEEIRAAVAATPLRLTDTGGEVSITLSIGLACGCAGESMRQCISRADECLYRAKDGGRDCVVAAWQPQPERRMGAQDRRSGTDRRKNTAFEEDEPVAEA